MKRRQGCQLLLGAIVFILSMHAFDAFVTVQNFVDPVTKIRSTHSTNPLQHRLLLSVSSESNSNNGGNEHHKRWNKRDNRRRPLVRRTIRTIPTRNPTHSNDNAWLIENTERLLNSTPGSLTKGKWHEVPSTIRAWARRRKDDPQVPYQIESLIKRLTEEMAAGNTEARTTVGVYNHLIDAWACAALFGTHDPQAASQRTREILVSLQQAYEQVKEPWLQPTEESFHMTFHVVFKFEGLEIARKVLAWMEFLHKNNRNEHSWPRRKHYIQLLEAYSMSGTNAGALAEGFLRHMKAMGEHLDTYCYNLALKGWARSKRGREAAEHVDRILEDMGDTKDLVTYSTAMSAWGASGMRSHAMARVESLLDEIVNSQNLVPNTVVLNTVMSTCVKSRDPESTLKTERLLNMMIESPAIQPDLISFNTHLHALSMHAMRPGNAEKADKLLRLMETNHELGASRIRPNRFSYNLVIDAWSRADGDEAAWNAVRILRRLIDDSNPRIQPDTFSFNQVLSSLSRSTRPGAARLAEQLLEYMVDAHRMRVYKSARPDVLSYTFAIVTLTRSGEKDSAMRAEKLLHEMKKACENGEEYLKPTRYIYNTLIDCWAKSGHGTYGARRAEALFQEMEDMYASGDSSVSPNIVTWNAVLNSWARSGTRCGANKAEKYLERMWDLYNSGDEQVAPNEKTFNTVINAISKGPYHDKAQKALRVLRRMDRLYQAGYKEAKPDEITYTSVLNSCAFPASLDSKTKRKAFDTAVFTWEELKISQYANANDVTFGTFIRACSNLLNEDEETLRQVLGDAFQQCKEAGQVGEIVLCNLRTAAPLDLYEELLSEATAKDKVVGVEDLPFTWRRNIAHK